MSATTTKLSVDGNRQANLGNVHYVLYRPPHSGSMLWRSPQFVGFLRLDTEHVLIISELVFVLAHVGKLKMNWSVQYSVQIKSRKVDGN